MAGRCAARNSAAAALLPAQHERPGNGPRGACFAGPQLAPWRV